MYDCTWIHGLAYKGLAIGSISIALIAVKEVPEKVTLRFLYGGQLLYFLESFLTVAIYVSRFDYNYLL